MLVASAAFDEHGDDRRLERGVPWIRWNFQDRHSVIVPENAGVHDPARFGVIDSAVEESAVSVGPRRK
jgi:hypothetical protein